MKIEESKKEINKLLKKEIIAIIIEFLSELKLETAFSALYFLANYRDTHDFGDSIGTSLFYMILLTLMRRLPNILSTEDFQTETFNRLEMYYKLRNELKDNINRFEKITPEQLPEGLEKLLKFRYN